MKNSISALFLLCTTLAYADMPFVFTAGSPAVASEVNANFSHLGNRIDTVDNALVDVSNRIIDAEDRLTLIESLDSGATDIEKRLSAIEASSSEGMFQPFSELGSKKANMGDLIATIGGADYVLGALPFMEYGTGQVYKVTMPLRRMPCEHEEPSSSNNSNIDAFQCAHGGEYYYIGSLRLRHTDRSVGYSEFVSGYPAAVDQFWHYGEVSTSSSTRSLTSERIEDGGWLYRREITPSTSATSYTTGMSLFVQVGETNLQVQYQPPTSSLAYDQMRKAIARSLHAETGPDFTGAFTAEQLDRRVDFELFSQYMSLFDYISIVPLN